MRYRVSFRHPAGYVPTPELDCVAIEGAAWFVELLKRAPHLAVDDRLCQEDWGVVVFVERNKRRFWVGLSWFGESDDSWLAHFHHAALLQRLSTKGHKELDSLVADFHQVLVTESVVSDVQWYDRREVRLARAAGAPSPREP